MSPLIPWPNVWIYPCRTRTAASSANPRASLRVAGGGGSSVVHNNNNNHNVDKDDDGMVTQISRSACLKGFSHQSFKANVRCFFIACWKTIPVVLVFLRCPISHVQTISCVGERSKHKATNQRRKPWYENTFGGGCGFNILDPNPHSKNSWLWYESRSQ